MIEYSKCVSKGRDEGYWNHVRAKLNLFFWNSKEQGLFVVDEYPWELYRNMHFLDKHKHSTSVSLIERVVLICKRINNRGELTVAAEAVEEEQTH